jgi:hypothetical protein
MPYKDPGRKKEWEQQHRAERLARRRELRQRRVDPTTQAHEATHATFDGVSALLPVVGGLGLAAYQPKLAVGAGGLTLLFSMILKKEFHVVDRWSNCFGAWSLLSMDQPAGRSEFRTCKVPNPAMQFVWVASGTT